MARRAAPPPPEESFRALVDGIVDYAISMLDPEGRIVTWNQGAERIYAWSADEVRGEPWARLYPPDGASAAAQALEVARREGRFEEDGWRVRRDGSPFWANVVVTARRDPGGQLLGFSSVTRDQTDRRLHEDELRQSEERFRLMVEGVRDYAIFMLDPEGRVMSWNEGAERIKGYRASEILGRHFSQFYPPDAVARSWPQHELSVARREGRFEDEGWRVRKDGSRFWANVVITALRDETGELRGFAKVTRDLTERRRIERLEEEGRRTTEFLAMLGHELRNPLASIRTAVAVMRSGGESRAGWARDVVDRQVRHLVRIVDDLLDFGRISAGKITVRKEPVDLRAVVMQVADTTRPQLERRSQPLDVRLPDQPVIVRGDGTRLSQVVQNLLTNALKYTPPGGAVSVELVVDRQIAELRVHDEGIGIAPELLQRIFEPFVQAERALDRSEGGLGIGLALVRGLVELHDGTVSASSRGEGQGTTFVVRLPLGASLVAPRPSVDARPAPTPRRVLVVDDNIDAAETLAELLRLQGHDVHIAVDGPTALAMAERHAPEVILLDLGLPGMDGFEVARRLRGGPALLVALTGYGQPEDAARTLRAGFAMHLVKPVEPERLYSLLADAPARPDPRCTSVH